MDRDIKKEEKKKARGGKRDITKEKGSMGTKGKSILQNVKVAEVWRGGGGGRQQEATNKELKTLV